MKSFILAAVVAVIAPATQSFADYTPIGSVFAPQPAKTSNLSNQAQPKGISLNKKNYSSNSRVEPTASSVTPTFGRRPVLQGNQNVRKAIAITVGSTVTAPARFLGKETGCVFLQVGPTMLECQVLQWKPTSVTFVVPNMGLGPITPGKLQIVRGDGDVIRDYPVSLIRKPDLIIHEEPTPKAPSTIHERVETLQQN